MELSIVVHCQICKLYSIMNVLLNWLSVKPKFSHTHSASISITSATLLTEMWYDFTLNLFRFEKFGMFRWARIRNKNQLYLIHQFQCEIYIHHRGNSFYFRFQMGYEWCWVRYLILIALASTLCSSRNKQKTIHGNYVNI